MCAGTSFVAAAAEGGGRQPPFVFVIFVFFVARGKALPEGVLRSDALPRPTGEAYGGKRVLRQFLRISPRHNL